MADKLKPKDTKDDVGVSNLIKNEKVASKDNDDEAAMNNNNIQNHAITERSDGSLNQLHHVRQGSFGIVPSAARSFLKKKRLRVK